MSCPPLGSPSSFSRRLIILYASLLYHSSSSSSIRSHFLLIMMRISTRQALMLFFLTCASVVATSSPSRQQRIAKYEQHAVTSQQNEYATTKGASFLPVVYVSIFNSAVNMLRPDPAIIWQV